MGQDLEQCREVFFTLPMDTHSPSQLADTDTTHNYMARCEEAFVCESLQNAVTSSL
jgi:hypothetical protein